MAARPCEVEAIVADYRPPVSLRDRARPVCVAVACRHAARSKLPSWCQLSRRLPPNPTDDHSIPPAPRLERRFQVQFLASERFMKKFEKARALLSNRNGKPSFEAVLEAALDEFLKDHDPEQRKRRREKRKQKAEARTKSEESVARINVRSQSAPGICGAGWGQLFGSDPSSGPRLRRQTVSHPQSLPPNRS